jgi:hypothetical protein
MTSPVEANSLGTRHMPAGFLLRMAVLHGKEVTFEVLL